MPASGTPAHSAPIPPGSKRSSSMPRFAPTPRTAVPAGGGGAEANGLELEREAQHGARIGVLVAAKGADAELVKQLAMHIAASKPDFINPGDVPAEVVAREHQIQIDIAMQSGKPREIAEKMVEGRMRKFTGEISLTGQAFVMDPSKTVDALLKEHKAGVAEFIRFEVGEGMEKKNEDFAAEVAKQMNV